MKQFFLALALCLVSAMLLTSFLASPSTTVEPTQDCLGALSDAFSPNGDGINDQFQLDLECEVESFRWEIYNEADELLFESESANQAWDGTIAGEAAPEGFYRWVAVIQTPYHASTTESGEIALVR
ncbi:MAG: gliding motility-associated C-terminal domain-containing protein [Bacteroidota bacterium]